jgi:hypothetical protein
VDINPPGVVSGFNVYYGTWNGSNIVWSLLGTTTNNSYPVTLMPGGYAFFTVTSFVKCTNGLSEATIIESGNSNTNGGWIPITPDKLKI